jgi:DNA-binding CsgD family transcriptional regulator
MLAALGLTAREADALAWLAQGKTNPEIAIILDIHAKTVSKHLERVYRKLGVETRTAAAAIAIQTAAAAR